MSKHLDEDAFSNYLLLRNSLDEIIGVIETMSIDKKVEALNFIKERLHEISPFKNEPVDCVVWVKCDDVEANDYNPNKVAPPEMRLLTHSIDHDGYTQPIVTMPNNPKYLVVDGFHRKRVGTEVKKIKNRVHGYLPITKILNENVELKDRMAATVRHNRARGKHGVTPMAEMVKDLYVKGWTDAQIAKELGMEAEEVLRLKQFTGLPEAFANKPFSNSWEVDKSNKPSNEV